MLKLLAGSTRSAAERRWRSGRAEMRAAMAETRLDWVKVTISGSVLGLFWGCETTTTSPGLSPSSLLGS